MPHEVQHGSPYATVTMATGAPRKRRVAIGAPASLQAALLLTAAQLASFHAWFEDDLQAGALPFAACVLSPGAQLQWWHARFAAPPELTSIAGSVGVQWQVAAQLRLEGEPASQAPT
jgi:hypothetical protein